MLCGHYVGSDGVALESCLGYDPPSGLYFLWPPKKYKSYAVNVGGLPFIVPNCLRGYRFEATPAIWTGDFVLFAQMTDPGRWSLAYCHGR